MNTNMADIFKGIIRGRTIELEGEPRLPVGQEVTVAIKPSGRQGSQDPPLLPGEGLRRAFGGWSEDAGDLDLFLEWSQQQRQVGRPEIQP